MSKDWKKITTQELSLVFIDHIENSYYKSYLAGSEKFEKIYNRFFNLSILIGFLISTLSIVETKIGYDFSILITLLPLLSSFILMISSQKGWKEKQEMREMARIKCKHLINEARLKYTLCRTDEDYSELYRWLNREVEKLQLEQAKKYFTVHNKTKE